MNILCIIIPIIKHTCKKVIRHWTRYKQTAYCSLMESKLPGSSNQSEIRSFIRYKVSRNGSIQSIAKTYASQVVLRSYYDLLLKPLQPLCNRNIHPCRSKTPSTILNSGSHNKQTSIMFFPLLRRYSFIIFMPSVLDRGFARSADVLQR